MSADKGAAVVIYDDLEPQYGVDRPVPAGDEETHGLPTDCEVTEAMGGEYTSVSVHPHPNGARAFWRCERRRLRIFDSPMVSPHHGICTCND